MKSFYKNIKNKNLKNWFLLICVFSLLGACKNGNDSDSLPILSRLYIKTLDLTLSGTAVKGLVKNGVVKVYPLGENGACNSQITLGSSTTAEDGTYSVKYTRTGGPVCLNIESGSTTTMYDEKSGKDVPLAGSTLGLSSIVREDNVTGSRRSSLFISPFTRMIAKRVETIAQGQTLSSADRVSATRRASKEIVIRFGLNRSLSSRSVEKNLSDADVPELEELNIDVNNPNDGVTQKFVATLCAFSQLANSNKTGATVSAKDTENVINAFVEDFSDGKFDGKSAAGTTLTIGSTPLGANSLTSTLLPALQTYVAEGGRIGVGTGTSATISLATVSTISFTDTATITSTITLNSGFKIGGTVSGLTTSGLVIQNNGADDLTIASGATSFQFPGGVSGAYAVTIKTQPTGQYCSIANGTGEATANVTGITITCTEAPTWTLITLPDTLNWSAVEYGNGIYIATAFGTTTNSQTNIYATSPDGITWTSRTFANVAAWYNVKFGNGIFVAASNTHFATSPDGINWTYQAVTNSGSGFNGIAFGKGIFLLGGVNVQTSTNGRDWTVGNLPSLTSGAPNTTPWFVFFLNDLFFAYNGSSFYSSTDAVNWTARTFPTTSAFFSGISYGNGIYVAVSPVILNSTSTLPSSVYATSRDGITWTVGNFPVADFWYNIAYGNGVFVVLPRGSSPGVGTTTNSLTSTDGLTWTLRTTPLAANWISLIFANQTFVSIGYGSNNVMVAK